MGLPENRNLVDTSPGRSNTVSLSEECRGVGVALHRRSPGGSPVSPVLGARVASTGRSHPLPFRSSSSGYNYSWTNQRPVWTPTPTYYG